MGFREEILAGLKDMRMDELRGLWELVERVEARKVLRENRRGRPRKKEEMLRVLEDRLRALGEEDWRVFEDLFRRMHLLDLLEETWRELEEARGGSVTIRELVETARQKLLRVPGMRRTLKEMSRKELQDAIKSFTRMRLLKALEHSLEEV